MSGSTFALIELLLVFGLLVGLGVWDMRALKRDRERTRERERRRAEDAGDGGPDR